MTGKPMNLNIPVAAALILLASGIASTATEEDEERFALGREVFLERAEPGCAICHALADAGADGAVGPDLDTLQPDYDTVMRAVSQGIGPMRPYVDLDETELDALAHYVATASGG
jgi:cytochrome c6